MIFTRRPLLVVFAAGILFLFACSPREGPAPQDTEPSRVQTSTQALAAPTEAPTPVPTPEYYEFPGAKSISAAAAAGGGVYIAFGQGTSIYVARSTGNGLSFTEPVLATGSHPAYVLPLERPALAVNSQGDVGVAWLEHADDGLGAKVWFAISQAGSQTFSEGTLASTEQGEEIVMAHVNLDEAGNPLLFWITDMELRFARSFDQGKSFEIVKTIGEGSCDCCQPSSVVLGDQVIVAYRNLVKGDPQGDIRDIVSISSTDGGRSFEAVIPVSDEHWYLNACPIAGPSLVHHNGRLYAAWMDGRQAPPGGRYDGNIWFAASTDLAQTFSANQQLDAGESTHDTLPVLAVGPNGRIHLAWEGRDPAAVYYKTSGDGGINFSPVAILAGEETGRGLPGKPSITVDHRGQVYLAWLDNRGASVASWKEQP